MSVISHQLSTPESDAGEIVCYCYGVLESEIQETIDASADGTLEDVVSRTCAGTGCTACHCRIRRMLEGRSPSGTALAQATE